MLWDGVSVAINWGYQPIVKTAIKWVKDSKGYWTGSDRGYAYDVVESQVTFQGPADELALIESMLAVTANRTSFTITATTGEEIFGADVVHTGTMTVAVVEYGKISRASKATYIMPARLRLLSPTYTGTASLATLRLQSHQYDAGSDFDLRREFTMDGTQTVQDIQSDRGLFRATFLQTAAEMRAIRRYLLTTARANTVAFPTSCGITEPWGQRMGSVPGNCKIIEWTDRGRMNYTDWLLEITFAQAA